VWPLVVRAQQPAIPVVGFLNGGSPGRGFAPMVNAFRQGLKEAGYVEGQNVAIEYRWANDRYDRVAALTDDLVTCASWARSSSDCVSVRACCNVKLQRVTTRARRGES
jgi:hypothetical protein